MKLGETVYSPEFDLVLACLRWPQEAVDGDRIRRLAQQPIRWSHLREIVDHHKVVPLFSRTPSAPDTCRTRKPQCCVPAARPMLTSAWGVPGISLLWIGSSASNRSIPG